MSKIKNKIKALGKKAKRYIKLRDQVYDEISALNNQCIASVQKAWTKKFPGAKASIDEGYFKGKEKAFWEPHVGIYLVNKLSVSPKGKWFDSANAEAKIPDGQPKVRKIEAFCKEMTLQLGFPVILQKIDLPKKPEKKVSEFCREVGWEEPTAGPDGKDPYEGDPCYDNNYRDPIDET